MERILYADDDYDVQKYIEDILSKEGYSVIIAKDGAEALGLIKAQKPDLAILDYFMPGLNGIEVCQALRKDEGTKDIPILMVTAYPSEKENSLSAGATDFINKPIDKTDLLLRIRSVLKVREIKNELQRMIAYLAELEKGNKIGGA
ncbi:MAG: response regulator [Candidatus Omnitrophica bacterium]|nr:response regulator [Candidatus Omnitrophota bacterium]